MATEQAKPILPLDYNDEDDSEEEEDEDDDELFDNSKVDWRVKGNLLRGKDFSVSNNGNCPRCQSNIFVFVILDELFPMGDMPEILYNLLAKGKAVLWSSQDKQTCKKPPTFMCKGFCPPDPLGAGFNINWDTVNLTKVLKDLLKLNIAKAQKKMQLVEKDEGNDEDEDLDEKDLIRMMLAKEKEKKEPEIEKPTTDVKVTVSTTQAKTVTATEVNTKTVTTSKIPVTQTTAKTSIKTTVTTTTANTGVVSQTTTAASTVEYPISKDGSCPYCYSKDVRYIILVKDATKDTSLPPTLESLLKQGKAFKMAKGANNTPSFQCSSCTYGFNLDWSSTNLKKIFNLDNKTAVTTAVTSSPIVTTTMAYQYPSYPPPSFQPPAYQNNPYGSSYVYPPMYGYPPTMPYGYPPPGFGIPPPDMQVSPQGYPVPRQQGYSNPYLPPHVPNMNAPNMGNMPGYGNPYDQQFPGQPDFSQVPPRPRLLHNARLRVPNVPPRGRHGNKGHRKGRWEAHTKYYGNNYEASDQWSTGYTEEPAEQKEQEEEEEQPVADPQAELRFEELLNKIDKKTETSDGKVSETGEEEKPPGEEYQVEFEVDDYTMDDTKSGDHKELSDVPPGTESSADETSNVNMSEPSVSKVTEDLSATTTQQEESSILATEPEEMQVKDKISITVENKESENSTTSEVESQGSEGASPVVATGSRKTATRGRKRAAIKRKSGGGGTRASRRKKVEKEIMEEKVEDEGVVKEDNSMEKSCSEEVVEKKVENVIVEESGQNENEHKVVIDEVKEDIKVETVKDNLKGKGKSGNTRRGTGKKVENVVVEESGQNENEVVMDEVKEDIKVETVKDNLKGKGKSGNTRRGTGKKVENVIVEEILEKVNEENGDGVHVENEPASERKSWKMRGESKKVEKELKETKQCNVATTEIGHEDIVEEMDIVTNEISVEKNENKLPGKRKGGNTRGRKKQKAVKEMEDVLEKEVEMKDVVQDTKADSSEDIVKEVEEQLKETKEESQPYRRVTRASRAQRRK